jgi:uncharacterized protein (TIGR00255 family)
MAALGGFGLAAKCWFAHPFQSWPQQPIDPNRAQDQLTDCVQILMPVYSMTGFGRCQIPLADGHWDIELRSVNSRFLDLTLKLHDECKAAESALRSLLTQELGRGKVELRVSRVKAAQPADAQTQNFEPVRALQQQVLAIDPNAQPLSVHEWLHWRERLSLGTDAIAQADTTAPLLKGMGQAVAALKLEQAREGAQMAQVMLRCIEGLGQLAERVEPLIPQAIAAQKEKYLQRFQEALRDAKASLGEEATNVVSAEVWNERAADRAVHEATAIAIRADVAEELARLRAHLHEATRLLSASESAKPEMGKPDAGKGKRLEFLIQEMHRECNTLGSKSAGLDWTRSAIDMKVLVEQLREQVQNLA